MTKQDQIVFVKTLTKSICSEAISAINEQTDLNWDGIERLEISGKEALELERVSGYRDWETDRKSTR